MRRVQTNGVLRWLVVAGMTLQAVVLATLAAGLGVGASYAVTMSYFEGGGAFPVWPGLVGVALLGGAAASVLAAMQVHDRRAVVPRGAQGMVDVAAGLSSTGLALTATWEAGHVDGIVGGAALFVAAACAGTVGVWYLGWR